MNISNGSLRALETPLGEHPYYPVFTENKKVFLTSISGPTDKKNSFFHVYDYAQFTTRKEPENLQFCGKNEQIGAAIKDLYFLICEGMQKKPSMNFLLLQGLKKSDCIDLVKAKWSNNVEELNSRLKNYFIEAQMLADSNLAQQR
ncbi:MAG: hypothetical protein EOP48_24415, partial [Sphingobacteriales bacterium]